MRGQALLPVLALGLAGCGGGDEEARYAADLQPLNGSGARGHATFALAGDHLSVEIVARGLQAGRTHDQAIHGFPAGGRQARCPARGPSADAKDADRSYGTTVRALQPFPTVGRNGRFRYEMTFAVDPGRLGRLDERALVLAGGGGASYRPELPVACGEIRRR